MAPGDTTVGCYPISGPNPRQNGNFVESSTDYEPPPLFLLPELVSDGLDGMELVVRIMALQKHSCHRGQSRARPDCRALAQTDQYRES
jgi:hypothetical protein